MPANRSNPETNATLGKIISPNPPDRRFSRNKNNPTTTKQEVIINVTPRILSENLAIGFQPLWIIR
jgi:hypothetical protein